MRTAAAVAAGAALLFSAGTAGPAVAVPSGSPVLIIAHTDFESDVSAFDAALDGCASGTVVNGENATAHFTPWGGVFNGDKEFTCAGGLSGFTLRLKARFGEDGSTGSWTVASGWGALEGLKGSGTLTGIVTSEVILDDVYSGSVR
jgi:hypothetical protein